LLALATKCGASGTILTTYVMGGSYTLGADVNGFGVTLNSSDRGQSYLAYPGQTPIFDGGGTLSNGFYIGYYNSPTSNITIKGLTFRNMYNGIQTTVTSNLVIANNSFLNMLSANTNDAAINLFWGTTNASVVNNLANGSTGPGIRIAAAGAGTVPTLQNITVAYNLVEGTSKNRRFPPPCKSDSRFSCSERGRLAWGSLASSI
jgi:hypothetical protein